MNRTFNQHGTQNMERFSHQTFSLSSLFAMEPPDNCKQWWGFSSRLLPEKRIHMYLNTYMPVSMVPLYFQDYESYTMLVVVYSWIQQWTNEHMQNACINTTHMESHNYVGLHHAHVSDPYADTNIFAYTLIHAHM